MSSVKDVQKWFKTHIEDDGRAYTLDKHQAAIVLDAHKNTLVTARAGSGKTRTIVAKIVYLLAHEKVAPEEIIVFAFNRKARIEINERLTKISCDKKPLFDKTPALATTFHAFAYKILGGKPVLGSKIITEAQENRILFETLREKKLLEGLSRDDIAKFIEKSKQFITRAEQKFFKDYTVLQDKIIEVENPDFRGELQILAEIAISYHEKLAEKDLINFNQMVASAAVRLETVRKTPYRHIFVDEYQDFSLLFLNLIKSLRKTCPSAHLLAVGDDWQAINRFAGSDVEYFTHFEKYFPENCTKLFIPTNYRSGKLIVKNANFFMSEALKDYNGCKSGNKLKSEIFIKNINFPPQNQRNLQDSSKNSKNLSQNRQNSEDLPLLLKNYFQIVTEIIRKNPGKTVKILHRNNDLSFRGWSLEKFAKIVREKAASQQILTETAAEALISESTIHRSKGLESDIVILLEIDAEKFPGKDKTGGLYRIFGDTPETLFNDEARLFYVALTRPKEKLYILSKTTKIVKEQKKLNFLSYLNQEWLNQS